MRIWTLLYIFTSWFVPLLRKCTILIWKRVKFTQSYTQQNIIETPKRDRQLITIIYLLNDMAEVMDINRYILIITYMKSPESTLKVFWRIRILVENCVWVNLDLTRICAFKFSTNFCNICNRHLVTSGEGPPIYQQAWVYGTPLPLDEVYWILRYCCCHLKTSWRSVIVNHLSTP